MFGVAKVELKMTNTPTDPLNGITLKVMLIELHAELGWEGLGECININCFTKDPSIKSSLTFLRRTPWARNKVETLYLKTKGIETRHAPTTVPEQSASEQTTPKQTSSKREETKRGKSSVDNPWGKRS